jgi:hypothetical protein
VGIIAGVVLHGFIMGNARRRFFIYQFPILVKFLDGLLNPAEEMFSS